MYTRRNSQRINTPYLPANLVRAARMEYVNTPEADEADGHDDDDATIWAETCLLTYLLTYLHA